MDLGWDLKEGFFPTLVHWLSAVAHSKKVNAWQAIPGHDFTTYLSNMQSNHFARLLWIKKAMN